MLLYKSSYILMINLVQGPSTGSQYRDPYRDPHRDPYRDPYKDPYKAPYKAPGSRLCQNPEDYYRF